MKVCYDVIDLWPGLMRLTRLIRYAFKYVALQTKTRRDLLVQCLDYLTIISIIFYIY